MHTERLLTPARDWMRERPTIAHEQLEDPIFSLRRAKDEIDELIEAIEIGAERGDIRGELTDVFNFLACAEYILFKQHSFTEDELVDYSHYVYGCRNSLKYPKENYQNGTPAKTQLREDALRWARHSDQHGATTEQKLGNEYY